ncbi:MAG: hypothetical protein AAF434_12420 [Pseudomonadota bacterium]
MLITTIKITAFSLTLLWFSLYLLLAKLLESQVFYRRDEAVFSKRVNNALKLDLLVFLFVFLRFYRTQFDRSLALMGDGVLVLFLLSVGSIAYLLAL